MTDNLPKDSKTNISGMDLGKMAAEGATALLIGEIISKLVGVLGSVFLIRLLVSPSLYAYIAIATVVPGIVMMGDLSGVDTALNRYLSLYKREKNPQAMWSSFWVSNSIKILTGIGLSLLAYFLAQPVSLLLGKPTVGEYLEIASSLPIVWTLQINIKCTLLPLGRARWYSELQIVNEVLLSSAPVVAVILGYGPRGALIALVAANFTYLIVGMMVSSKALLLDTSPPDRKITYLSTLKRMVRFGLPLGISGSVSGFSGQLVNLIIGKFVSLNIYGLYSVASSAYSLMNSISDPLSAMAFPIYSRIKAPAESDILRKVYDETVKISTAVLFPFAVFFIIFAEPFMVLFFGAPYAGAGIFLTVLSLTWLSVGMGSPGVVLTSQGYSRLTASVTIVNTIAGVVLALIAVPTLGMLGYLVATLLVPWPSYFLLIKSAKADLKISPPYSYVWPLYASALLSSILSLFLLNFNLSPLLEVIFGAFEIPVSFLFFAILLKGLRDSDARNLKEMMSTQPKMSKLVNPFIAILERTIKLVG